MLKKDATKIYFNSDDGDITGDLGTVDDYCKFRII